MRDVELPEGWERVLLVGGPYHLRSAKVRTNQYHLLIVEALVEVPVRDWTPNEPVDIGIGKTHEYVRGYEVVVPGPGGADRRINIGWTFVWNEAR